MQRVMRTRGLMVRGIIWIGVIAVVAINAAALAQTVTQSAQDQNQKQVFLIRKDTAECSGSDVPNVDSPLVGGGHPGPLATIDLGLADPVAQGLSVHPELVGYPRDGTGGATGPLPDLEHHPHRTGAQLIWILP